MGAAVVASGNLLKLNLDALELAHRVVDRREAGGYPRELRQRRDRTAKVQQMSRDNIEFFHNADISNLEERLDSHRDAHLWLYGYDVTRLEFCS